jgi:nitrate reductase NapE component
MFSPPKPEDKEIIVPSDIPNGGDQAAPEQPTPTASSAPAAGYTPVVAPATPAPAPAKTGPSALKIVLIVILVFVVLGILVLGAVGFMVWHVARSVHVSGPNGQVTMSTPGGTITANPSETYTAAELGTDIYPGATSGKGGMKMSIGGTSTVQAVLVTSDSKDQVVSFYKGRFGSDATVMDFGGAAILSVKKGNQETVTVTVTANSSQNGGKTQITISHTIVTKPS